jgi:hypothetical protein
MTAAQWRKIESTRHSALYQIAVLLEIPDLPPPSGQLNQVQWQQCIDCIAEQEQMP